MFGSRFDLALRFTLEPHNCYSSHVSEISWQLRLLLKLTKKNKINWRAFFVFLFFVCFITLNNFNNMQLYSKTTKYIKWGGKDNRRGALLLIKRQVLLTCRVGFDYSGCTLCNKWAAMEVKVIQICAQFTLTKLQA